MLRRAVWIITFAVGVCWSASAAGQGADSACGVAPIPAATSQANIFSDQQEMWLGQVTADLVESEVRFMRDPALSAHLQAIADRLVATLPPTKIQFRVILVDSEEVNGFSIAGGHVYIMRKLAAVAKSDDELAGVIGHEIGHIISHQFAFESTRELKRLSNVTGVGDEADIRTKYEAMLDAEYHDKHPELRETDSEQAEADRIGIYAMTAAGYRPQAIAEFFDRVFFLGGKTGNKLSDLLRMTKPDQKRLRSMNAMIAAIPAGCGKGATPDESEFAKWHEAVVANQKGSEVERSAALSEVTLTPPLRMQLDQVRFSPDGKSILAQDESSIFVLGREPLALRYRIDANNALPANFSPDSQSLTFSTPGLHIEQWSAQEKKLLAAHEMLPKDPCYDTRLSPDGRSMVCVQFDVEMWELGLSLLDSTSSEVLWEQKWWMRPDPSLAWRLLTDPTPVFVSSYSGDGNTLLFAGGDEKVAFDLKQRAVMKTGSGLKGAISGDYAFVGNDKVAGVNLTNVEKSGVFSFPEGKLIKKDTAMNFQSIRSVSNSGDNLHMLVYGLKDDTVAINDVGAGKFLMAIKGWALDEYAGTVVGEAPGGALVVGILGADATKQHHIDLPISPLPFFPRAVLSKDGKYFAMATMRRGGVWEVATGNRIAVLHGYSDATWTDDDTLYMDVPKDLGVERHIAQLSLTAKTLKDVAYKVDDDTVMRYGRMTNWKLDEKKKTWTLSMHDPANDSVLWSKSFPDRYFSYTPSFGARDLIFNFDLSSHTAKEAIKADAKLASEAQAISDKKRARLIKVVDGNTGDEDGSLVVELPPNFAGTYGLDRAGDLLYVRGVDDRTSVYSIATGKQVRQLIGYVMGLDPVTARVFTANRIGEGMVYGADGKELAHYHLGDPIRYALFREGATMVTILTADQKVRTMKVGDAP